MKTLAYTLIATALATTAMAQEAPRLSIGGGVMVKPEYSGADTYDTTGLPFISASKEITPGNTLYLRGLQAGLDHAVNEQLTIGAVANYRFERDASDSSRLTGMPDIDGAIEIGPKVRYQLNPQVGLEATALFDVSDAHEGYTARIGADYAQPLSEVTLLTVAGGLSYGSEDFNNTYYGVTPAQARPGRAAYTPDSGLSTVDASIGLRHKVTNHWSVQGKLGAEYLLADVADSPLVEQELQPSLMLGLTYTF